MLLLEAEITVTLCTNLNLEICNVARQDLQHREWHLGQSCI
jgi:hypothetical protein